MIDSSKKIDDLCALCLIRKIRYAAEDYYN